MTALGKTVSGLAVGLCLILVWVLPHYAADGTKGSALARASVSKGVVQDPRLKEVSGLVASRTHPGYFWTHNDSGDKPWLYLIDSVGHSIATFELKGAKHVDWEDIAIGPGPKKKLDYLYVADIGDNAARRGKVVVYRVPEPDLEYIKPGHHELLSEVVPLPFHYFDGARDAETLLIDPIDRNLVIITKRSPKVHVYVTSIDGEWNTSRTLDRLRRIPFTNIVGGDLSADGSALLLKTYTKVLYWKRETDHSLAELFDGAPRELPYQLEPQGEAIAWSHDGTRYYTLSEERAGVAAILYGYPLDTTD